jgi:hypothetical protein
VATKTFDEILAVAEDPAYRRIVSARIPLVEQRLRDEHAELDAKLTDLRADGTVSDPERDAIVQRIAEIETIFDEHVVEFKFRNIGHRAWSDLLAKHPPTPAQLKANRGGLDHNPATFPYEAMAATCVLPEGGTPESFRRLDASVDTAGWTQLWVACIQANVQDAAPKSVAASILRRSAAFLATAASGASPAASSSVES